MTRIALLTSGVAAVLGALLAAAPAQAASKTFVASTGSGTACTRAAPCASFATAAAVTDVGGEINCLDSGPIGGGTMTNSITIDCAGMAATTNSIGVNGAGIIVTIRNLTINSVSGAVMVPGIDFINGASLFVENCLIQNFTAAPAVGIRFRPSAPGSRLVVSDTTLNNNGSGATGGAIVVNPQSAGNATVSLERVIVADNVFGIAADGSGSTAGINMTVANSTIQGNSQNGIVGTTPGGGAPIGIMVENTRVINNNLGIRSTGTGVTVRVSNATLTGNGAALTANNGGLLLSFGNNKIEANGDNGAFSDILTQK